MQSGIVAPWKRCLGRQSAKRGNERGSRGPSCQSEPGCPSPPSRGMKPAMPTPCWRPHDGWLKRAASISESSCPTQARNAKRRPTQRSLAASRTVCGPTTRSPLWRHNFAVSDPDAPPLDSESLVSLLDRHGVAYVLVGGLAAVAHGATRATFDIDIVPRWETHNLDALAGATHPLDQIDYRRAAVERRRNSGLETRPGETRRI